jgi:uncharacterized protein YwbE
MAPKPTPFVRHVHYVAGFDPRGWRLVRGAMRESIDSWAQRTGTATVALPADPGLGFPNLGWEANGVSTRFVFLNWDATVREHWPTSDAVVARNAGGFVLRNLLNGTMGTLRRHTWPLAVCMLSTALPLAAQTAVVAAPLLGGALGALFGWGYAAVGAAGGGVVGWWGRRKLAALALRLQSAWTGRVAVFAEKLATDRIDGMEVHIERFAQAVAASTVQADETIVVGHSTGGVLGPMILDLVAQRTTSQQQAKLSLLTVGSILAYVATHPHKGRVHAALGRIARRAFFWLDVSSPRDGAGGALVDPFALARMEGQPPLLLNAQFHKGFDPERLEEVARTPLDLHFLYFRSPDAPDPTGDRWDWPATLLDPRTLHERYGHRPAQTSPFAPKIRT